MACRPHRLRLGASTVAKAYRLLKAILNTAVPDELLVRNPCMLRGAASERTPERRPPTLAEVQALATVISAALADVGRPRSGLRWGELLGLTRRRVNLLHGTLIVVEQPVESDAGIPWDPEDRRWSASSLGRPSGGLRVTR